MDRNFDSAESPTLLERYVALATKHGEATESGHSEDANEAYAELNDVFSQLLEQNQREALVPLLRHPNSAVRAKVAFHTHVLDADRSESTLEEVSKESSLVGFSAGMTLREVKSGRLTPP